MGLRRALVLLHRWVSLLAGLLLVLLGLSGSVLVWQNELDAALNPAWFAPRPACASEPAPVARVLEVLATQAPDRQAAIVVAPLQAGAAYQVWETRDPASGWRREHFIDASCGRYLGSRDRGALRADAAHLLPALYELHRYLWSGPNGATVAGIGGLILAGLGLSGVYLAWPRQALSATAWRRVLGIKRGASAARLWFDVHRAVGLWLAPLLLLLSLTGAALVFDEQARALVGSLLPLQTKEKLARLPKSAQASRPLPPDALVAEAQRQVPQAHWSRLTLARGGAPAEVRLLQPGEPRADTGNTRVRLGADGQLRQRIDPLQAPAGNVVMDWLFPLHSAEALGLAARLLWSVFGLVPALLIASGAWLWWRRLSSNRQRTPTNSRPCPAPKT